LLDYALQFMFAAVHHELLFFGSVHHCLPDVNTSCSRFGAAAARALQVCHLVLTPHPSSLPSLSLCRHSLRPEDPHAPRHQRQNRARGLSRSEAWLGQTSHPRAFWRRCCECAGVCPVRGATGACVFKDSSLQIAVWHTCTLAPLLQFVDQRVPRITSPLRQHRSVTGATTLCFGELAWSGSGSRGQNHFL
jgi:hypothetical protein